MTNNNKSDIAESASTKMILLMIAASGFTQEEIEVLKETEEVLYRDAELCATLWQQGKSDVLAARAKRMSKIIKVITGFLEFEKSQECSLSQEKTKTPCFDPSEFEENLRTIQKGIM